MENSGEFSPPIESKIQPNRQEFLNKQLEILNPDRKDHQVLNRFLTQLYDYKNYSSLDESFSKNTNVRYQPKAALEGNITKTPFCDFYGIYEYQPVAVAVEKIEDHFNIFSNIQEVFKQSEGKSNREIISEVAKTISEKTDIPICFADADNDTRGSKWVVTKDGNLYSKSIGSNNVGMRVYIYKGSPEIISDIQKQGFSEDMDFKPIGDAIILNNSSLDQPQAVQTCLHEVGHIAEDRFILPQKEEDNKDKSILNTEVISSLYGLKASFLMAEHNPDLALQMMISPVSLYNWILTGTVAP